MVPRSAPTITQDELIKQVRVKLASRPHKPNFSVFSPAPPPTQHAAYALILGAGFSYGVVPLTSELMQQTIGDYYCPDLEMAPFGARPASELRKASASFWAEFNAAATEAKLPKVELNKAGVPSNDKASAAYQNLFDYMIANALFRPKKTVPASFLERLRAGRKTSHTSEDTHDRISNVVGERFVKGLLQFILNPGAEYGYGATGRNILNSSHVYLGALLEVQQLGQGWKTGAFCRTIFTTNFDTLLQNALQLVNLLYRLTDGPETGFKLSELNTEEGPIHLVYVHGSVLRYNPASTINELDLLASKNVEELCAYLEGRDVIVLGYSGWKDCLMTALHKCDPTRHRIYWCGTARRPSSNVETFLIHRSGSAAYVQLGRGGADDLMRSLYEALVDDEFRRDPMQRYRDWTELNRPTSH